MRAWQTSLTVLIWGLALGVLLWGTGWDLWVQAWWAEHHVVAVEKTARFVSDVGLGRNQIIGLLLVGLWLGRGHGWCAQLSAVQGCFVQLGLWLMGRWVWCSQWAHLSPTARWVWLGIPVFALTGLVNVALKFGIGRPRPKEWLWNGFDPYTRLPWSDAGFMSLPSGHTASTAAIATILAMAFPRLRGVAVVVVVMVAAGRVLTLTSHYVGDVVAGAAVGFAVAYGVGSMMRRDADA